MRVIFHLHDTSTDFLKPIYEGMKDIIVVRSNIKTDLANQLIEESSQVIMMGHGGPHCLFGRGRVLLGEENVQSLKKKSNNIFIWCHASEFVFNHELKGFSTGMFISEEGEALHCLREGQYNPDGFDERSVIQSNDLFAEVVRNGLDTYGDDMAAFSEYVKSRYIPENISHTNKNTLNYNAERLKLFQ